MAKIKNEDVKRWIARFKRKLKSKYSPEIVILFGSRARGDSLTDSKIDPIVVSKKFVAKNLFSTVFPVSSMRL